MKIDELMEKLRADYLESFDFKIDEIRKRISHKQQHEVIDLFHQIKGSGKTYGFDKISEIAEQAEYEIPKANQWYAAASGFVDQLEQAYKALISS